MSPAAVTPSTTFLDINQMLLTHKNLVVRLVTQTGMHHFETMESFPHQLGLEMLMESAGVTADSHIRFMIPVLGGLPSHDSKCAYITSVLILTNLKKLLILFPPPPPKGHHPKVS